MKAFALRLARRLLLFALDEGLRQALPRIYNQLDAEMPIWQRNHATAGMAENRIRTIAEDVIGHSPTADQLTLVRLLYDPVKAIAANTLR